MLSNVDRLSPPQLWAVRRMRPYPEPSVEYARVELDPITQTARYFDEVGRPVAMPKHGTSTGTRPPTGTSHDGKQDTDHGSDTDQ